jgi:hypothetical protein
MDIEDQSDIPAPANKAGFRATLLIIGLAFIAGTAAMGWGISRWDTGREWLLGRAPERAAPPAPAINYTPDAPQIAAPLPTEGGLAVAALEARLAKLETVSGASPSSPRAEAMFTAFAARRAIDRGLSLGALEPLLSQHFGATQPQAVSIVIGAAQHPISSNQLLTEFASVKAGLAEQASGQGWWDSLASGLTQLVTIRDENAPSTDPQLLIAEADQLLGQGRVEQALALIARTPNRAAASEWTSRARRYIQTQRALDLIEGAAFTISQ